jgi:hypothetical protein
MYPDAAEKNYWERNPSRIFFDVAKYIVSHIVFAFYF